MCARGYSSLPVCHFSPGSLGGLNPKVSTYMGFNQATYILVKVKKLNFERMFRSRYKLGTTTMSRPLICHFISNGRSRVGYKCGILVKSTSLESDREVPILTSLQFKSIIECLPFFSVKSYQKCILTRSVC